MRRRAGQPPQVSVIMPVHDGERWLAEAVESVLAQTLQSLELICVDDGSADGSLDTLQAMAAGDERLRIIRREHGGVAAALNSGLSAARAPLVARLDADDLADPSRLEKQARRLDEHPAIGVLGSWAVEIDERGSPRGRRTPPTEPESLKRLLKRGNPLVHSTIMARTELLRRLGGYRPAFEGAEDYDLWLRASAVTRLANLPETLVGYRVHAGSVSRRRALRQAFSVRLAKMSAELRDVGDADPADGLTEPPDWNCPSSEGTFYAAAAALYRWMERRDGEPAGDEGDDDDLAEALRQGLPSLSHDERRMAASSLALRLRSADRREARRAWRLLLRLLREHPRVVVRAAWSRQLQVMSPQ